MKRLRFDLWMRILVYMNKYRLSDDDRKYTAQVISIRTDSAVGGVSKIIKSLREKELISVEKKGRKNSYIFTNKGLLVAKHLGEVIELTEEK